MALKVVLVPPEEKGVRTFAHAAFAGLSREFQLMSDLASSGAPVVAPVLDSLRLYSSGGALGSGYLLSRVCAPLEADSSERCAAAFGALAALHVHGAAHGDARLPNLLVADPTSGALSWIDLRAGVAGLTLTGLRELQRIYALVLAQSMLGGGAGPSGRHKAPLPPEVLSAAAQWEPRSPGAVQHIAEAVWRAR